MFDFFARQQQARLNAAKLLPYLVISIALTHVSVRAVHRNLGCVLADDGAFLQLAGLNAQ